MTTEEPLEKNVGNAVMVPLVVSRDEAVNRDVMRWKDFEPDIKMDCSEWSRASFRYNEPLWGIVR